MFILNAINQTEFSVEKKHSHKYINRGEVVANPEETHQRSRLRGHNWAECHGKDIVFGSIKGTTLTYTPVDIRYVIT